MNIKIIGTGCDKCDRLYENVQKALSQLQLTAQVEKVEDLIEIVKLGVMTSPSLMIDGRLLLAGQDASYKEVVKLLQKETGK